MNWPSEPSSPEIAPLLRARGTSNGRPTQRARHLSETDVAPDDAELEKWARERGAALDFVPQVVSHQSGRPSQKNQRLDGVVSSPRHVVFTERDIRRHPEAHVVDGRRAHALSDIPIVSAWKDERSESFPIPKYESHQSGRPAQENRGLAGPMRPFPTIGQAFDRAWFFLSPYGKPAGRIPTAEMIDPGSSGLVSVNKYGDAPSPREKNVRQLTPETLAAFRALRAAAAAAGFSPELFTLASDYRSQKEQDRLFARALEKYKSEEKARKWVAKHSEHVTGRAIDFNLGIENSSENAKSDAFARLPAWQWLSVIAPYFGFNPYAGEQWHFSYNVQAR